MGINTHMAMKQMIEEDFSLNGSQVDSELSEEEDYSPPGPHIKRPRTSPVAASPSKVSKQCESPPPD